MRVCIIVDNLSESAGWGRLAFKVGEGLGMLGHQIKFIVSRGKHSENVVVVPMRGLLFSKPWQYIVSIYLLRQHTTNYDLVISFDANPYGIFTSIALLGTARSYWLYCIGSYSLLTKNWIKNLLIRFAYLRAEKKLVVSEFVLEQIEKSGLTIKKHIILPVGVDGSFFYKVRRPSDLINGRYILSVGGIKYRKGFHLSIEAFSKISKVYPDISYVIVGQVDDEGYYQSLLRRISELNLESRIFFLGIVSDDELRSLYSYSEFFLLTPITNDEAFEGFGMVYLEAAMCGSPSIGTNNSGAREAIINNVTGLLVDPDPDKISEAAIFLLSEKKIRDKYANNAVSRSSTFLWSSVNNKLNQIIIG